MGKSTSLCVLLVLTVLWKPAYSENKCATGCKGSSGGPAYLSGHKYSYSVEGDATIFLTGAEKQETGVRLSAQVTVSALGNCAHVLRVQNLIITGPGGKKYGKPPGIEKPVRFTLENGALGAEICAEDGDTRRSLNIKRAIISLLQNEHKQASEVDVFGVCPTQSSSSQEGSSRLVHRSRDLGRCAHREQGGQGLVSAVYNPTAEIRDSQVLQSSLYVESKVTNGVPEKVAATEEYLYRPFSVGQNGARAKVNTKLSLVGKSGGSDNGRFTEVRSIIFENPRGVKSEQSHLQNALKAVRDTAKLLANEASFKSAGAFAEIIRILRVTNKNDLLSVYAQVKGNSLEKRVFLDALLRTGTGPSIEASVQLVKTRELSQLEQNLVYLSLGNAKHVNVDAVKAAATLLDTPNIPKSVYLGVGALAGAYCREHKCHSGGSEGVLALSQKLASKLNCRPRNKVEEDYTVAILKGIRNIRHIEDCLIGKLVQCVKDDSVKARVKVAALEAYQADSCSSQLKDTAIEIMKNRNLDSEIRIKAYLTVIQCPCGRCANEIKNLLDDEPSIQVGRFISTSLRHIKASTNPDKQLARQHFSQIRIPTKYSVDDRKYSFYRELSFNVDALGTGGVLEQSVIYSQDSFLPRSASLNLTAEVFGHSLNVFEIGGRQGNLDRVMEHFLGPKGYIHENNANEIYDDLKRRYEEVQRKVQGRLRGRRSIQQDINNFDKQIKEEGEPYNNELDLDIYVKLFGTDAVFLSLGDNKGFNFNSVLDSILNNVETGCNTMKHFQEEVRAHLLFLDAELAYPTSLGFPLKLNLIGSATGRLEASSKIDVKQIMRDPNNAKIDIKLIPSTDIEISGQLVVDADQVSTGLKVSTNLHSSVGGHITVQILENGQGFDLQYVFPGKKLEIVTASNDLVYVTTEKGQHETTVAIKVDNDRKEYSGCFDQLSGVVGLTVCGEISVPFSVSGPGAQVSIQKYLARYPLTGSSIIKIHLVQNEIRGYHIKGLIRYENPAKRSFELLFETQGAHLRKTALTGELVNSPEEKTVKLALESPITNLNGQVSLYNNPSQVAALVLANMNNKKYYGRMGFSVNGNEQRSVYTPLIEYEMPDSQGKRSLNVEGQIVKESSGPTTRFTLQGLRINLEPSENIAIKGQATFSPNGFESDLEASQGSQNMKARVSVKQYDLNVRFTNTLNPNVNFDLKVYSENRNKYYQNDLELCYGDNLNSCNQKVLFKQLLKYERTDSGKYNVHTRNEFSINHIPLSAKAYAEIDSKKVDIELEGKFGANKAKFDLDARTHIKSPGDYSVKIDANVDNKGIEVFAKRDIVNADKSNFENVFAIKNMVKYELSGVVTHRNKADDLNLGAVGHLKLTGAGKTEVLNFDVGVLNNPAYYSSHAEITKSNVKYVDFFLKVVRGSNPSGQLKFELKGAVSCNGNYKVTDADGSGNGIIIVDFVKLNRKYKGDVRFKVKAPIYTAEGDLYLDYERNNNDKIHFSTNTKRTNNNLDSKNKVDYNGKCTELNIYVDGATNVANGKSKGNVQVIIDNERTIEFGLTRDISTHNEVVNGNAELVLSDTQRRGETPTKFVYKSKIINTNYEADTFNYEGQILVSLKDGRNLQNSFFVKNIPKGDNKFNFDFKSEINGNLIPKPVLLTASNEYKHTGRSLLNEYDNYRVKGSYGSDCSFELDFKDENQFDVGDKKYYELFVLTVNLPFEKAHYIKLVSDELYLYPENKDEFEYNLKESIQFNGDEYRFDASGKIGRSDGYMKSKVVAPHIEPLYVETTYKTDLQGEDKSGVVAIKSNYGRGKTAVVNIEATKLATHEYTLKINANAPQAERLKKLDITFNTKKPTPDTYNSNIIVDADGKVYKLDYLIVYSKANPVLDIKLTCPEFQKTCRVYMKGNNLSSNQGKWELKLENIKDLSLDLTSEGIIQKDNIALKVHANSEKLGLKDYYSEITSKDTGSGKRLEFQARNNNVNLLSGSTSFISKQEGSKMIIEGSGTVRVKEQQKSATFKYIRDILTEGQEQGIETFVNIAIGERSYVAESRVTNLEYKYSYVYCEEKKQCAHAELNSKINLPNPGVFQHNVNIVLDLRKLGFAPEFGLQMLNEVSQERLPQYTLDVYLNKENKKYHVRVYSTPKENQLPAGITITLPHREIALESVVTYRGDKVMPFPIKGEISLYMDKNKPQQKTSIRGLLDVVGSSNEQNAVAEFGFSHPRLGREAVVKVGGFLKQSSDSNYRIECVSSFSHPHFGNERSSKFIMEVTPRTFKLMVDTPLVKVVEIDAEGHVHDNVQEGKLKFSLLQGRPVQVYAVAKDFKYYEFTTSYSDDTQRKLSIVGQIDPEKRVDVSADVILPGEKKNIAHGSLFIQDDLVRSAYGASEANFNYFVMALQKDLDNLKGRISQLGTKASDDYRRNVDRALQLSNQLRDSYRREIEQIKQELANDNTFQEFDKGLEEIVRYVGKFVVEIYEAVDKIVTEITKVMQENAKRISEMYEKQLRPELDKMYANLSAIIKEYTNGLVNILTHFIAYISDFVEKHKAELQELTNIFTEIIKDLTRMLINQLKLLRQTVAEGVERIMQQIKSMAILENIKNKFKELQIMEQILTVMHTVHDKIKVFLPNEELRQFADAVYKYVEKKLTQQHVDERVELRAIYEKFAVALSSLVRQARQQLNDMGVPSLFSLAMPQLNAGFFGNIASVPSFGAGSSSFSLINQALNGELPSALELIKAYRPRYIDPLEELPNKLRAVVVNGQHIFTFDGRHLTFPGSCRYVLSHDYVDRNFTLLIQLQKGLPKALVLEDKSGNVVELKENGQVALNGAVHGFPVIEKDLFAFRETNGRVGLGTRYGLIARCTSKLTVCYIEVSGYYFSKLRGLLGDGNNEPYTDFKLPSGKVTTSEAEFGNSYRLAASCPPVRTPDHSHHHVSSLPAACEQVFGGQSPLRPLSLLLDVEPFKQACTHACTANPNHALQEACDLARGYTALAVTGLLPAFVPPACLQCNDADKPRKVGEDYTIELPGKQADIIVAVETTKDNERNFKNIAVPVVAQVIDSLKAKRINDIKVYLVGITPKMPYPIVYDTDLKLKTAKVKFDDVSRNSFPDSLGQSSHGRDTSRVLKPAFDAVELISYLGIDNVMAGYLSLLEIPVRAGAVKTTISVVGDKCRKRFFLTEILRDAALVPMFKADDHTQNIIAPASDLRFDGKESRVIAYDSSSVLVYGDKTRGKDTLESRRKLFNPPDACTDFVEIHDGLVISASNFERNAGQQKEFVQTAGTAIVDKMLSQRRTQTCLCAYADPFTARSTCVPTSIKQNAPKGRQRRKK